MELREKCLLSPISDAGQHAPSLGQRYVASHFSSFSKLGKRVQLAGAAGWRAGIVCPALGEDTRALRCAGLKLPLQLQREKANAARDAVPCLQFSCIDEMKGAAQTNPKGSCSIAYS